MKILITGGHITPALAVIEELKKRGTSEVVIVGRKYSLDKEKALSFEYKTISKKEIRFVNLSAGRFLRHVSFLSILSVLKIPGSFIDAFGILKREKPGIVLSFGGYIAFPVCLCASMLRIPVFTHEQTMRLGITNKLIAQIAKKVFVSFEETLADFPKGKTVLTGNPVRNEILRFAQNDSESRHLPDRILYITGGSLGSHSLNIHIENILDELLQKYTVIHQTGNVAEFGDYERLKKRASAQYIVKEHVEDTEIGSIYKAADVVVSRAGANTICELIVLEKPCVLVPLPWSSNGEQQAQAEFLQKAGVAEVFDQKRGSRELLMLINNVYDAKDRYKKSFSTLQKEKDLITHAASCIADKLL